VRVRCLIKGLKESKEMERKDKFFFFFTCLRKREKEGFELVTFASCGVIHSQLSYLMSHDRQGLLTVHVWVWIKSEMDR
jgi:hypothetical protein